jgi:retron-type reverse transcriptase
MEHKIKKLEDKVRKLERDLDNLYDMVDKALSLRAAIVEIQDELQADGKMLIYSGRWLK